MLHLENLIGIACTCSKERIKAHRTQPASVLHVKLNLQGVIAQLSSHTSCFIGSFVHVRVEMWLDLTHRFQFSKLNCIIFSLLSNALTASSSCMQMNTSGDWIVF